MNKQNSYNNGNQREEKGRIWLFVLLFVLLAAVVTAGVILGLRYLRGSEETASESAVSERKEEKEAAEDKQETEDSEDVAFEEEAEEWVEPGLVLLGESTGYPERDAFEVELTVLVSSEVRPDTLEILLGGETVLTSVAPEEFPEERDNGFSLSVSVTVPAAQEGITAECITARMGNTVSDDLILYREVTVTEEMEERLCLILDESAEEIDKMLDSMEEGTDLADVAEKVVRMLQARSDIEDAWLAGDGLIRFITVDQLASNIWLRQVSDEPEKNTLGVSAETEADLMGKKSLSTSSAPTGTESLPGSAASSLSGLIIDPEKLEEYLYYYQNYRATVLDPDVAVLSPVSTSDPAFRYAEGVHWVSHEKGFAQFLHKRGRVIADTLGGRCDYLDDQTNERAVLEFLLTQDLTQYGTIMILTHGTVEERYYGAEMLELLMFRSKNEQYASAVWNNVKKMSGIKPFYCVDYRYKKGGAVLTTSAQLMLGLYYDFKDIHTDFSKYYGIVVTAAYFESRYSSSYFPGTLILLDACDSLKDKELSSFFVAHGCSCVLGFDTETLIPVAAVATYNVLSDLMEEKAGYNEAGGARFKTLYQAERGFSLPGDRTTRTKYDGNKDFVYEGCGWLSGELLYKDHTPVSDGQIFAWRLWNGSLQREAVVRTDSEGRYEFDRLSWGVYLLQAFDGQQQSFQTVNFSTVEKRGVNFYLTIPTPEDGTSPADENTGEWIGLWVAENGESVEVYEQHDDCIYIVYKGYTASGESMFTSYYTLYFDDESHLSASEEDAVLQAAGWRYRLILEEDRIVMESRYPDRYFYRSGE